MPGLVFHSLALIQHLRIKCIFPFLPSALESEEGIENDSHLERPEACVSGETLMIAPDIAFLEQTPIYFLVVSKLELNLLEALCPIFAA